MSDKFIKTIKQLNLAYKKMNSALQIMCKFAKLNKDLDIYYWRMQKSIEEFNKQVLKELHKHNLNDEFKKITDKFHEK